MKKEKEFFNIEIENIHAKCSIGEKIGEEHIK